jgi:hypothetical protein
MLWFLSETLRFFTGVYREALQPELLSGNLMLVALHVNHLVLFLLSMAPSLDGYGGPGSADRKPLTHLPDLMEMAEGMATDRLKEKHSFGLLLPPECEFRKLRCDGSLIKKSLNVPLVWPLFERRRMKRTCEVLRGLPNGAPVGA